MIVFNPFLKGNLDFVNQSDRLISVNSSLILSDNTIDQTLAGNLGNLIITSVSGIVLQPGGGSVGINGNLIQYPSFYWQNLSGNSAFQFVSLANNSGGMFPTSVDGYIFDSRGTASKSHTSWQEASSPIAILNIDGSFSLYGQLLNLNASLSSSTFQVFSKTADTGLNTSMSFITNAWTSSTNNRTFSWLNGATEQFGLRGDNFAYFPVGIALGSSATIGATDNEILLTNANSFNLGSGIELPTVGANTTIAGSAGGVIRSNAADGVNNCAFVFQDQITRTQGQNIFQIRGNQWTGLNTGSHVSYALCNSFGQWSFGYGDDNSGLSPVPGAILGFIAGTATHPSYSTGSDVLKTGGLFYIQHSETTLTISDVIGVEGVAFGLNTNSTIPTGAFPYNAFKGLAGNTADSASFAGKQLAVYRGFFTANATGYNTSVKDNQANANAVYGNFDVAAIYYADFNAYRNVMGGPANPTNKPGICASARFPIQGIGSTDQSAIYCESPAFTTATLNPTTRAYVMNLPFPSNTSATNRCHLYYTPFAAANGGPTWAAKGGDYFDDGTNNPIGNYIHDGTSWRRNISVLAYGRSAAQIAAVASVTAYTVPASDASFEISMNILVTTSTLHNFTAECAYTDEGNTARVVTLSFNNLAGALINAITNAGGAVPYEGVPLHIRAKAATTITLRTQAAGTYTTVTFNVEGTIKATS